MRRVFTFSLLFLTLAWSPAWARTVYLNGVKLDANVLIKNQVFSACEVRFDENGDVWITAKGYKVNLQEESPGSQPAAPAAPQYWLVSQQTQRGAVQYDVEVWVNGTLAKKIRSADSQTVLDVTRYVHSGDNQVHVVAVKNVGDKRVSTSAADVMEIVLGEGRFENGTITIDRPVVDYKRNASETQSFTQDFTFVAK